LRRGEYFPGWIWPQVYSITRATVLSHRAAGRSAANSTASGSRWPIDWLSYPWRFTRTIPSAHRPVLAALGA